MLWLARQFRFLESPKKAKRRLQAKQPNKKNEKLIELGARENIF
jgi:hypothetical protein